MPVLATPPLMLAWLADPAGLMIPLLPEMVTVMGYSSALAATQAAVALFANKIVPKPAVAPKAAVAVPMTRMQFTPYILAVGKLVQGVFPSLAVVMLNALAVAEKVIVGNARSCTGKNIEYTPEFASRF